jgi:predicted CopG family antitoxin
MSEYTTVRIETKVLESLYRLKRHPRESYNEVISDLIEFVKDSEEFHRKFVSAIQKTKMKELWNNKDDEGWERV